MRKVRNECKIFVGILRRLDHLREESIDKIILVCTILKWILEMQCVKV